MGRSKKNICFSEAIERELTLFFSFLFSFFSEGVRILLRKDEFVKFIDWYWLTGGKMMLMLMNYGNGNEGFSSSFDMIYLSNVTVFRFLTVSLTGIGDYNNNNNNDSINNFDNSSSNNDIDNNDNDDNDYKKLMIM